MTLRRRNLFFHACAVFVVFCPSIGHADILIEDDNFLLSTSRFPAEAFALDLVKIFDVDVRKADGVNTDETSFIVFGARESEFAGFAQLVFVDETLDASSDWYVAELDQTFSSDSIASGVQERWGNDFGEQQTLDVRFGEDIWFGVNTGIYFREDDNGMLVPRRDIFGWIQLRVDADLNVAMIDNAMAFESGQIIIGRNLIPEPKTNLIPVLLAGLLLRRLRNRE